MLNNEQGEKMSRAIEQADRLFCDFFKKVKGAFERTLFTGVTPVVLDGVVTGNNVAWNIAGYDKCYQMLGFSTEDIRGILTYYKSFAVPCKELYRQSQTPQQRHPSELDLSL